MKKAKLSLGLMTAIVATIGLSACDVTAKDGVILTYTRTDPTTGNTVRVDYTAEDLFEYKRTGSTAASNSFDQVYEVLVRNYFEKTASAGVMSEINRVAQNNVNALKQQAAEAADSNGTSYAAEWESILDSNGVDNVDELFSLKQYEEEKSRFESDYYADNLESIRDGGNEIINGTETSRKIFQSVDGEGVDDEGYLKEKVPYHVSHILVNVDGSGDAAQDTVTEANAKKLSNVVKELAGDTNTERKSFENLAISMSDDTGSASSYGSLDVMDKDTDFVPEFKLGVYAFEALYNKKTTQANEGSYRSENATTLLPDADTTYGKTSNTVQSYFEDKGIGVIPYGAAIGLLRSAEIDDYNGLLINGGSETFYPRNVLFNKYFNQRNVCVIVPTEIPYNEQTDANGRPLTTPTGEEEIIKGSDNVGTLSNEYASLPGFKNDTSGVLDLTDKNGNALNCMTDAKGRIILVARANASYQGIHFIVIDRSGLDEYADNNGVAVDYNASTYNTTNVTSLSDYYTIYAQDDAGYPTYTPSGSTAQKKTTYNNFITMNSADLISRRDSLRSTIRSYNDSMSTYIFESLINGTSNGSKVTISQPWLKTLLNQYIETRRDDAADEEADEFNDAWADFAEVLDYNDSYRAIGDDNGMGYLISETAAITYQSNAAFNNLGDWAPGEAFGIDE